MSAYFVVSPFHAFCPRTFPERRFVFVATTHNLFFVIKDGTFKEVLTQIKKEETCSQKKKGQWSSSPHFSRITSAKGKKNIACNSHVQGGLGLSVGACTGRFPCASLRHVVCVCGM